MQQNYFFQLNITISNDTHMYMKLMVYKVPY